MAFVKTRIREENFLASENLMQNQVVNDRYTLHLRRLILLWRKTKSCFCGKSRVMAFRIFCFKFELPKFLMRVVF